jgi:formate--tetrahydrofolate ligase
MLSDLEIAQSAHLQKIGDISEKVNITQEALVNFGPYMAKINIKELKQSEKKRWKTDLSYCNEPNSSR